MIRAFRRCSVCQLIRLLDVPDDGSPPVCDSCR
jgi:hypothetical protein